LTPNLGCLLHRTRHCNCHHLCLQIWPSQPHLDMLWVGFLVTGLDFFGVLEFPLELAVQVCFLEISNTVYVLFSPFFEVRKVQWSWGVFVVWENWVI
jgi:hypothetical protein